MSLWRQLTRGLRVLTNRKAADQDVADEVQDYLEQATAAHVASGLSPQAARRAAQLEYGNQTQIREEARSYGWENALAVLFADLRYAARRLRRSPGFTLVSAVTLALGIGATTAIFSAVNPILFQPLPYPHANQIMSVWEFRDDGSRNAATFGMYRGLLAQQHSFDSLAVFRPWRPTSIGVGQPERLDGQRVSASYFHVLGVAPILGTDFDASQDHLHGPNVVILSDALWRLRFGADPNIVGRQITLDESDSFADTSNYTVIGVMAKNFENVLAPEAQLWVPLQYDLSQGRAWGHHLRMAGRLESGVTAEQASRELTVLGHAILLEQHPGTYGSDVRFSVISLQDDLTRGVRPALLAILGAVLLVLLIACVNVTNLLLARGVLRQSEFALRSALGAVPKRLIRQLLTESLLLAALGGVAGMAIATLCVRALVAVGTSG